MDEWLDRLNQTLKQIEGQQYLVFGSPGADDSDLATVEQHLGYTFSPSHRAFLAYCNGATLASSRILSTNELLAWEAEWATASAYQTRPDFLRVFRTVELSSEVYAFDTRVATEAEYPVILFDPESFALDTLKPKFPSFEAMLLHDVHATLDAEIAYMLEDANADLSDAESEALEAQLENHIQTLQQIIETRGGDLSDPLFPD